MQGPFFGQNYEALSAPVRKYGSGFLDSFNTGRTGRGRRPCRPVTDRHGGRLLPVYGKTCA